jgi:hypothetical protein
MAGCGAHQRTVPGWTGMEVGAREPQARNTPGALDTATGAVLDVP